MSRQFYASRNFQNKDFSFFHIHTVHLDIIKAFYLPTDAQVNCLKTILIFILNLALKQLQHVPVQSSSSSGSALFELAKVTVVKIIN
jgi:hypothetical protein